MSGPAIRAHAGAAMAAAGVTASVSTAGAGGAAGAVRPELALGPDRP